MILNIIEGTFSVCRLNPENSVPDWVFSSSFYSISRTSEELSIVCDSRLVTEDIKAERGWGLIKVQGPLDFGLKGILSSLANPLAAAEISIFVISTFDTDYLMVKQENLQNAKRVLEANGFTFN